MRIFAIERKTTMQNRKRWVLCRLRGQGRGQV